jgi:F-box and leucine-rich repeat protein GRR1
MQSVVKLLENCQKLTHLSLTGVTAFLRSDLEQFCRDAPQGRSLKIKNSKPTFANSVSEFTDHQRSVFCVFSGMGVTGLRRHLMNHPLGEDFDQQTIVDDDQTMTGMMGAAALNVDDDGDADADADDNDDLDDNDAINGSFVGAAT